MGVTERERGNVTDGREKISGRALRGQPRHISGPSPTACSARAARLTTPCRKPGCGSAAPIPARSTISGGWLTHGGGAASASTCCARANRGARSRSRPHVPRAGCDIETGSIPSSEVLLADSVGAGAAGGARKARAGRAARLRAARHVRPSPSTRSRRSSGARRPRRGSSPAGRAAGCRAPTACPRPISPRQRRIVDAFLAASRGGDFEALLAVLDPNVVFTGRSMRPCGSARRRRSAAQRPWPLTFSGRAGGARAGAGRRSAGARRGGATRKTVPRARLHHQGRQDRRHRSDRRSGAASTGSTWRCSTTAGAPGCLLRCNMIALAICGELAHMRRHRRVGRNYPAFPINGTGCVCFLPFRFSASGGKAPRA